MDSKKEVFSKFSNLGIASPSPERGIGRHFDLSKGTMEEKLELIKALIEDVGEGNAFLVVTTKDESKNIMLGLDTIGADVMG